MEAYQSMRIAGVLLQRSNTAGSEISVVSSAAPAQTRAFRLGGAWLARRRWPAAPVAQAQVKLEWYGVRAGVAWPAGATLREYSALLEPHVDSTAGALCTVVDLVERARYGARELSADEQQRLLEAGERVWAQLRRWPRWRREVVEEPGQ
jgi:uncharacterized protein DUF4129